ncbi:acyl-CoA dehydrogenase family protein [Gordonia sp. (in: high G+C Gram-positive bacteria)]|jgi:alkylation response protein AidB-like acyl-CoA dehydrogenase|uniref:acyl-CoA dehydrogenase family protein n=2 Tax=Gordonia sp. (in: high G+C Gram-positive bacteria) TaxID=84139 RepID=UPI002632F7E8|nr:acyl-CoA dehydrogenase family protein [Gordonia sp. (in: high G+C Gram-positive bacteria)]HMS75210.1 acyl-CoA dehydrogenase family protein [Gordonia sp. (in: high G+C Gram-positive bacteria)]
MLLELDSDQRLWQKTVQEFLAKECSPGWVRRVVEDGSDPDPLWRAIVAQGWTELAEVAETVELAIALEELGRASDPTPYLATMTHFAPLTGTTPADGHAGAAAYSGVNAARVGDGWVLDGIARSVVDGDRARQIAVVTGAGVFVVDAEQVTARRVPIFDPLLHVADLSFTGVRVADDRRVTVDVDAARRRVLVGLAATIVGACQRILDLTLEHVGSREQFGAAIGSFQAVKHKAADMHVAIERARALTHFAALSIAADTAEAQLAASMAKAAAGECQSLVFRNGYQLFGAMGYTWENDLQFALKRAKAADLLFGGADHHRALITEGYRATQL